jgi:pantoate--beta-alanine ligase
MHLSPSERGQALCLFKALSRAKALAQAGEQEAAALAAAARREIEGSPLARLEYLEVVDAETLEPVSRLERPARMCLAAWLGNTRLIDNMSLD